VGQTPQFVDRFKTYTIAKHDKMPSFLKDTGKYKTYTIAKHDETPSFLKDTVEDFICPRSKIRKVPEKRLSKWDMVIDDVGKKSHRKQREFNFDETNNKLDDSIFDTLEQEKKEKGVKDPFFEEESFVEDKRSAKDDFAFKRPRILGLSKPKARARQNDHRSLNDDTAELFSYLGQSKKQYRCGLNKAPKRQLRHIDNDDIFMPSRNSLDSVGDSRTDMSLSFLESQGENHCLFQQDN
jgi:hypothetical protein